MNKRVLMKKLNVIILILLAFLGLSLNAKANILENFLPTKVIFSVGDKVLAECGQSFKLASIETISTRNNIIVTFENPIFDFICGKNVYTKNTLKTFIEADFYPGGLAIYKTYDDILVKCHNKYRKATITSLTTSGMISYQYDSVMDAVVCGSVGEYYKLNELVNKKDIKKF